MGTIWVTGLLQPYIKNIQIFKCPSYGTWQATLGVGAPGTTLCACAGTWYRLRGGYGPNYADQGRLNPWLVPSGRSEAEIQDPAGTLPMADSNCVVASPPGIWPSEGSGAGSGNPGVPNTGNWAASLRHNEGATVVMCDGHAKWYNAGGLGIHTLLQAGGAKGMRSITAGD